MAIRFFLLQNRQGKTRLSKWYVPLQDARKRVVESEIHRIVTTRDAKYTNFVEYAVDGVAYKIVYRRYAGLFFSFCVDSGVDNELMYLESIHLLVELLDSFFSNVCELDLVFNFPKVYDILDEFIVGGHISDTSKAEMISRIKRVEKIPE